ncbi:MAG: hypothetical protein LBF41_03230, partial [Deltaproteobacteria bacterium]|nr:hypothetical protein [Deltaproteobacteria bacterium]
ERAEGTEGEERAEGPEGEERAGGTKEEEKTEGAAESEGPESAENAGTTENADPGKTPETDETAETGTVKETDETNEADDTSETEPDGDPGKTVDDPEPAETSPPENPFPITLRMRTIHHEPLRSLIFSDFEAEVETLFSLEANAVFLGVGKDAPPNPDPSSPELPGEAADDGRPLALSLGGFSLTLRDKGLAFKALSVLAGEEGLSLEDLIEKLKLGASLMVPAKMDPLAKNADVIEGEVLDFLSSPGSLFVSVHPEAPLELRPLYENLTFPRSPENENPDGIELTDLLRLCSVSFGVNGRDPVIVFWRETPLAFDTDIRRGDGT